MAFQTVFRHSIEKPAYKEKLRIRSYSQATPDSTVFVELKKKYEKVVYKRRLPLCERDAMEWVCFAGIASQTTTRIFWEKIRFLIISRAVLRKFIFIISLPSMESACIIGRVVAKQRLILSLA